MKRQEAITKNGKTKIVYVDYGPGRARPGHSSGASMLRPYGIGGGAMQSKLSVSSDSQRA